MKIISIYLLAYLLLYSTAIYAKTCITIENESLASVNSSKINYDIEFIGTPTAWGFTLIPKNSELCLEVYHTYKVTKFVKGKLDDPTIRSKEICFSKNQVPGNNSFHFYRKVKERKVKVIVRDNKYYEKPGCS